MTDLLNTAEGGTDTVTVTTANSGGASGDAWTSTTNGSGGAITYTATGAYRGSLSYLHTQPNANTQFLDWDQATATAAFQDRFYIFIPASLPNVTHRLIDIRSLSASLGNVEISTTGQLRVNAGTVTSSFSVATLSTNTWYRFEMQGTNWGTSSTTLDAQFFVGDSLTPAISVSVSGSTSNALVQRFRYGKPATSGISTWSLYKTDDHMHRDSAGSGLGPSSSSTNASAEAALATASTNDVVVTVGSISTDVDAETAFGGVSAPFDTGASISLDYLVAASLDVLGQANDALVQLTSTAITASATGAANDPTILGTSLVTVASGFSAGTGAALQPLVLINGTSVPATALGDGTAFDATVSIVLAVANAPAGFAETTGLALDATVLAENGTISFFTTPTVQVRWSGRHGLWSRMHWDEGMSVLRFGDSFQQIDEPSAEQVTAADAVFIGGRTYPISKAEARRLRDAGYGQWVTDLPDPEEHVADGE